MADLLVTGTDTGVGKTVVAAALVAALRSRGVRAVGFKPVETGIDLDESRTDSRLLARSGDEHPPAARPVLRLHEPLAPALAAERAGVAVEPPAIEARVRQLREEGFTAVVEGAGGVLVPLAWDYTAIDLAVACQLDAVIVARAGLGTLNHVVLTMMALQARQVPIRGIVLNGRGDPPTLAESTNPAALARMAPGIRIVQVPWFAAGDPIVHAAPLLQRLL